MLVSKGPILIPKKLHFSPNRPIAVIYRVTIGTQRPHIGTYRPHIGPYSPVLVPTGPKLVLTKPQVGDLLVPY